MTPNIDDFDDHGRWTGTCKACGTNHDGLPPGTMGGELRCIRARAEAMGASHLVDQIDALRRDMDSRRDDQLRRGGFLP